jgi:Ni,Fe-hydrogenase III component G
VPPLTVKSIAPVDPPLQATFVTDVERFKAVACVIVALVVAVQRFASVTVTVYVPAATPDKSCELAPLLQLYVYPAVPPLTVKSIAPVDPPLQATLVTDVERFNAVGCVIVALVVAVQRFASVTVTVYVPATTPDKSCELAPLLQLYVYPAVPPLTVKSIAPVDPPLQATLVTDVERFNALGCVIVALVVAVQRFASVTVTVYDPAVTPDKSCVLAPLLQL